jgi:cation diffusion facilitator CzcD-associated flavoprotein CzcO
LSYKLGVINSPSQIVKAWIGEFNAALSSRARQGFAALFCEDSYWRDLLALTWDLRTFAGRDLIAKTLPSLLEKAGVTSLALENHDLRFERLVPSSETIGAFLRFNTNQGHCRGYVRLKVDPSDGMQKAFTVLSSLQSLLDIPSAPPGPVTPDDPDVLIIGAGHSGLMLATRLRQMDVSVLVIEKADRVGDGWRNRYNSLTLHNPIEANEFPYLPFPATFPVWLPKDLLADWLECYSKLMELNVWTGTRIAHTHFDEGSDEWVVTLAVGSDTERTIRCKHLVTAVGVSGGVPRRPKFKGLSDFRGTVIHSGEFKSGAGWTGKRALIIGTGNSGHDIAQDLYVNGASAVTIMQRGPTCVISLDPGAMANYSVYFEGRSIEDADLMNVAVPYPQRIEGAKKLTALTNELDREFLGKLQATGFKTYQGSDDTGFTLLYARGNGGYYINVGCSDLIIDRKVSVLQAEDVETFTAEGLRRTDGTIVGYDLIVLATGFDGMQENIRHMLGDDFADRIGPVWGLDEEHVMRNMWRRTAQKNFWIMGGSITEARPYSRFLALEIKASLLGLLPAKDALPLK